MMKLIPQTAPIAFGIAGSGAIPTGYGAGANSKLANQQNRPKLTQEFQQQPNSFKLNEDASETINFVLSGGPKWGFRIRQLNDNRVIVSKVNRGAPAEKSGLKVNDEILSVNQVQIVGNQPRSLLLQDHPEQQLLGCLTGHSDKSPLLPVPGSAGSGDPEPPEAKKQPAVVAAVALSQQDAPFPAGAMPQQQKLELSRLDFAYQLIKHSSLSSNLLLTVKRYLSPAYARASVAASNMALAGSGSSPWRQTPSLQLPDEELLRSVAGLSGSAGAKPASSSVHYAYKCCECYCDNEGALFSGNSASGRDNSARKCLFTSATSRPFAGDDHREGKYSQKYPPAERQMAESYGGEGAKIGQSAATSVDEFENDLAGSRRLAAYVETSLDDLSYASEGSSEPPEADLVRKRETNDKNNNLNPSTRTNTTASGQSADEEDERRLLLLQLRNQQRRKQEARLAEQQQLEQQQQQQQQREMLERRAAFPAASNRLESVGHGEIAQLEAARAWAQEEEAAPEVPVRRSSQVSGAPPGAQYTQIVRERMPRVSNQRPPTGSRQATHRPSQPPPPPPRRDSSAAEQRRQPDSSSGSERAPRRSRAPKDIWSPSSSSLTSSSCEAAIAGPDFTGADPVGDDCNQAATGTDATLAESQDTQATVIRASRHLPGARRASSPAEGEADLQQLHENYPPPPPSLEATGGAENEGDGAEPPPRQPPGGFRNNGTMPSAARSRTGSVGDRCGSGGGSREQPPRSLSIATSTLAACQPQKYWTLPATGAKQMEADNHREENSNAGRPGQVVERTTSTSRKSSSYQVTQVVVESSAAVAAPPPQAGGPSRQLAAAKPVAKPPPPPADFASSPAYKQTTADEPHCLDRQNNYRPRDNENIYYQEEEAAMYPSNEARDFRPEAGAQQASEMQKQTQAQNKDEWFRQMYRKMHQNSQPRQADLFRTLNGQPDTTQIKIKLKSPKSDHRYSPSYYSEEDFELAPGRRPANSPGFKPGNISDYLPGQSSISQQERNLILYHKLIDHIDRVFSSVLPVELAPRSYHTLQAKHYHSHSSALKTRQASCQQRPSTSKSGPQTPVSTLNRRESYYREPLKYSECSELTSTDGEHDKRCVFNRLLQDQEQQQQLAPGRQAFPNEPAELEPRKQYVAVQHGHDIPLKGLRKPAPQASFYKDHLFSDDSINIHYKSPTAKLLKANTFNEFELARIKRLYAEELASKLQRSKSSRLPVAGGERSFASHRRQTQSADRLPQAEFSAAGCQFPAEPATAVDLQRYQRAFLRREPASGRTSRNPSAGKRFGRALFDFQAKGERELSLRRGDLLQMLQILDHSWALVEDCQSGLQGLVPLNYVDYSVGCAVALRDVCGQQRVNRSHGPEAMLAMNKGEPITLLRRLSGHLYEASNTRQAMGLVWSNDLEIIKQPVLRDQLQAEPVVEPPAANRKLPAGYEGDHEDEDSQSEPEAEGDQEEEMLILESGERILAQRRRRRRRTRSASSARRTCCPMDPAANSARQQPANYCCQLEDATECLQAAIEGCHLAAAGPRRSQSSPYIASQVGAPEGQQQQQVGSELVPRLVRAKFAYKPRQRDELELLNGDILVVVYECDDGWLIGSSYATKQTGTFPGNFVEPI